MDVQRTGVARAKRIRRIILAFFVVALGAAATYGVSRMKPAAPPVEWATLWPDTVKRGTMLRDVHGTGTLVPEDFRWIPAPRDGLVQKILVRTGDMVNADTILLVLSNPDMEQTLIDAQLQIRQAEADLANTRAQLQSQILNQETSQATTDASAKRAKLQADANRELAKDGLISDLTLKLSVVDADNLAAQNELEKRRVQINAASADAQTAAQQARIEQLRAAYDLKKRQIDQLTVRAGSSGVVQQLSIEEGQRVNVGATLAKVVEPGRLKAELKVPETQAKDVVLGQVASIDTRNGIIAGRVVRIDPAAVQGTVTVDVQLEGSLPQGARPDLSVDGTIEIERLTDVLYMSRPAYGQANTTVGMFKVLPTKEGVRVQVKLGKAAVNQIQILEGLQVGEQVILSDMSTWDAYDRVRFN